MRAYEFINEARAAKQYDQRDIDDIKFAYDQGYSYEDIAKMIGTSKIDVANMLRKYYGGRERRSEHLGGALTLDDKVAITLAFADGQTMSEIAADMGIPPSLVRSVLTSQWGIDTVKDEMKKRRETPGTKVRDKVTDDMIKVMRDEYADGKSPADIADKLGNIISHSTVLRTLRLQPDWAELRAKWQARRKAIRQAAPKTTNIYRAGTIGNLRSKGPGTKHSYRMFSRNE
jgi:predicted transcriptional regulator